ncbi:hypothetical protein H1235_15810 [Pseudoxanthomonas sp. NC8]|nr:hypothetical protein H1235_15810 [Pseudoxanthomonas sp. NC8]
MVCRKDNSIARDNLILSPGRGAHRWGRLTGHRCGEVRGVAATSHGAANVALFEQGSTRIVTRPTEAGSTGNYDPIQVVEPDWATGFEVYFDFNDSVKRVPGANNVFNTCPTRNTVTTPQVSGDDTFGVFPVQRAVAVRLERRLLLCADRNPLPVFPPHATWIRITIGRSAGRERRGPARGAEVLVGA